MNQLDFSTLPLDQGTKGHPRLRTVLHIFDWLIFHYFLQLMSVGLAWKSAAKNNEKLVNQKYATLFLTWMPIIWIFFILNLSKVAKGCFRNFALNHKKVIWDSNLYGSQIDFWHDNWFLVWLSTYSCFKKFYIFVLPKYWLLMFVKLTISLNSNKLHIFWEGHKILLNLHRRFDWYYIGQI